MKKINIFLIILILVLGSFLVYKQLQPKTIELDPSNEAINGIEVITEENQSSTIGIETDLTDKKIIPEHELIQEIKNKRYLESTFMALEYSKVNNKELVNSLKSYLDNNSTMTEEDVVRLIETHEKTFLNRYLKVFVMNPDESLFELNSEVRRVFYQMKDGFETLKNYKVIIPTEVSVEGEDSSQTTSTEKNEQTYDSSKLQQGIQKLESVYSLVDDALILLAEEDIKVEEKWLSYGLTEKDIFDVIDKTNGTLPVLEENILNNSNN